MIPEIMDIIVKCITREKDHAREIVEAIIDSEQNYLFTNDLDYKDNKTSILVENRNDNMAGGPPGMQGNMGPGGGMQQQQ
jgi:serine/threonine protein phosphatase PrpC